MEIKIVLECTWADGFRNQHREALDLYNESYSKNGITKTGEYFNGQTMTFLFEAVGFADEDTALAYRLATANLMLWKVTAPGDYTQVWGHVSDLD